MPRSPKKPIPTPETPPGILDARGRARVVAERAGVSVMTVSRALNGAEGVSEATRRRICEIAAEVGYEPNSSAQALKRGTSDTIALLLGSSMSIRGEFNSETLAGLEQVVSAEGYNLLLMVPRGGEGIAGLIKRLLASVRCQAVVLRFDEIADGEMDQLAELAAPVVAATQPPPSLRAKDVHLSSVCFDNRQGIARAVRHLVSLGHRRIGYLGGTPGWEDAIEREAGFRGEMKRQGVTVEEEWIRHCLFGNGYETGSEALDSVLSTRIPAPTAVVCASDRIAAGAYACARRWDLAVPGALSITGFDDDSWDSFLQPALTTVRQDGFRLGQTLGHLVLEEIASPDAPGRHVTLDTPLIVRQSTAPPRQDQKERRK